MKYSILLITSIFLFSIASKAQNQISVCETKASHIISPEKVSYLQVGDHSKIVAEVVPEHPNLVRIKAVEEFDSESSLTIVSANKVYSLFVKYADTNQISYQLEDFHSVKTGETGSNILPEYMLRELSHQILRKCTQHIRGCKSKSEGMRFELLNIYLKNDALFFELEITNQTNLGYDVEGFHWWIDDKKQYKATNVQEYLIEPEYQHYKIKYIPAKTTLREVFVLPKLTIPDKRTLRIELLEKALGNTGRKLSLDVKNKDILESQNF
ncbi:conjugative transposon protein TraN [uncultured Draconibacterium sp.]|uniref:conjugative transposon protein TraN n=1 Tax=uncultured Draconibacterium sp. TaxID=1573823 RepID=UPI003217F629